jgi:hypothetical protein
VLGIRLPSKHYMDMIPIHAEAHRTREESIKSTRASPGFWQLEHKQSDVWWLSLPTIHIDGTNIEEKTLSLTTSAPDQGLVIVMSSLQIRIRSSWSFQPVPWCSCVHVPGPNLGGASRPGDCFFCTADLGQTKRQLSTWFAVLVVLCARVRAPG